MKALLGGLLWLALVLSGCASFERSRPWEGSITGPDKKLHAGCSFAGTFALGFVLSHQAWRDSGVSEIRYLGTFGTFDEHLRVADRPKRSTATAYKIGALFTFVFAGLGKEFLADEHVSVYDIGADAAGCLAAYALGSGLKIRW